MPRNALRHHRRRERGPSYRPNFELDFDAYPPSVANLPAALTINGTTVLPTLRYFPASAAASWVPPYGATLTAQAGTAPTYNTGSPLLGPASVDDGILYNGASYHLAGDTTTGNVATNDFVVHWMGRAITTKTIAAKRNAGVGWQLDIDSSLRLALTLQDAGGSVTVVSAALTSGAIYDAWCFVDRSGSAQWYVHAVASGAAVDVSGRVLTLNAAVALAVGADSAGAGAYTSHLYALELYQGAAWLDTHLQATVAATRFAQLTGAYPLRAAGTALPTALTRSTTAYLDKVEADGSTKLYLMGANWPRVCSRLDSAGVLRKGLLVESAGTNEVGNSQSLSGWTASYGDLSLVGTSPTGDASVIRFLESADTNVHWTYRAGTTAGRRISMFARANGRSWLRLISYDDSAYRSSYFNVSTGALGTVSSYHSGAVITSVPGWGYRVSVKITAGNDYFYWGPADSDGGSSYAGDVTKGIDVWQIQVENGAAHPSSVILTPSSSPVTRTADVPPYYKADDGNVTAGRGACEVGFLASSYDQVGQPTLAHISDGDADDRIALHAASAGDDVVTLAVTSGATAYAAVASTTDVYNGSHHKIRGVWNANDARLLVDGTSEGTPDVTVTVPTGLTRIDIGGRLGAAGTECNGLITRLAVYR